MNGGQIGIIVLYSMSLACYLVKHGEPKKGTYNFGTGLFACILEFGLLWWGGFWA